MEIFVWSASFAVYAVLGVLTGIFFGTNAELGRYPNFKALMIALLWPLTWVLSLLLAFWDWLTEE